MTSDLPDSGMLSPQEIQRYLVGKGQPDAKVIEIHPLGEHEQEGLKCYGYGKPLLITYTAAGERQRVVLRTMAGDRFGHDRRADRLAVLTLSLDTFDRFPQHVRPIDGGVIDARGGLSSLPRGEPFLVTSYAEGEIYAHDLRRLAPLDRATPIDLARAQALADYLVELHIPVPRPDAYVRSIRDTIGSGEGIFGLVDSYPANHPIATARRLESLELQVVRWRRKLREQPQRARRVHGDFHPFNLLFRDQTDLTVLDASRGGVGDAADDVSCLAINYLFFALASGRDQLSGALSDLWLTFWRRYLERSKDRELLSVVPIFFTWRVLVVASPIWYPNVHESVRSRLLAFVERLLDGQPFDPERIEDLVR